MRRGQHASPPCPECFYIREERIAILMFDAGKTEYAAEKAAKEMNLKCDKHQKEEEK